MLLEETLDAKVQVAKTVLEAPLGALRRKP